VFYSERRSRQNRCRVLFRQISSPLRPRFFLRSPSTSISPQNTGNSAPRTVTDKLQRLRVRDSVVRGGLRFHATMSVVIARNKWRRVLSPAHLSTSVSLSRTDTTECSTLPTKAVGDHRAVIETLRTTDASQPRISTCAGASGSSRSQRVGSTQQGTW